MSHSPEPKPKLQFRKAQYTDAEKISQLVNSAYRGDSSRVGWTTEADLLGGQRTDPLTLQTQMSAPQNSLYILEENQKQILGVVHLKFFDGFAYLGMLTISPTQQGSGLGKRLLKECETLCRSLGLVSIEMTVIAQRLELIAWYERHGYHRTGEERPFPYGDLKFGEPKREDLYFMVLKKELTELTLK